MPDDPKPADAPTAPERDMNTPGWSNSPPAPKKPAESPSAPAPASAPAPEPPKEP